MRPYKRQFIFQLTVDSYHKPEAKAAQMEHSRMLVKCAIEAFKLQPRTFNSLEVNERDNEAGIHICVDKKLHCKLFSLAPFSDFVDQDALSGRSISHHVHKLAIRGYEHSINLSKDDCLYIGSCTQIQELIFSNIKLLSFQNCHYNSLQVLSLSSVSVDTSLFPALGHLCPKLKELRLRDINIIGAVQNDKIIDMEDLRLQRLNLTVQPTDSSEAPWLIVVKTHKEYVYIKVIKRRVYKILTYEGATEEERDGRFNGRCCITCYDIQELVFNDEKIALYPDSITSDIAFNDED